MLKISSLNFKLAEGHDYSSTQINVPKELAKKVLNFGKEKIKDSDLHTGEGFGREDNIHVTVKYGLLTNNPEEVKNAVKGFGKLSLRLRKISRFEADDYDVIKIDVESGELKKLNKIISELPNEDSHPKYIPHCTIAYVKKGKYKELEGYDFDEKFEVDEIVFSRKNEGKIKISLL